MKKTQTLEAETTQRVRSALEKVIDIIDCEIEQFENVWPVVEVAKIEALKNIKVQVEARVFWEADE